jgi:DNA repair protein RadC
LRNGFDGMADYEAVELLLTFFIPRVDVKERAKLLVSRFGSFRGVADANVEELASSEAVTRTVAENLTLLRKAGDHYLRQRALERLPLDDSTAIHAYCRSRMGALATEEFRVFYVDGKLRLIEDEQLDRGTVDRATVFPREVVNGALARKAPGIIVAHNHPTGDVTPSEHDKTLTRAILLAATTVGLTLHDHLVVGADSVFSFREEGLL